MSDLSNNIAILTYLKEKVHKWKNIAIFLGVIAFLLLIRLLLGSDISKLETGSDYVANIKIDGIILEDDYRSKTLEEIAKEDSVKAVIVNIDSPGGGIVGSEILFNDLKNIAQKKPLVVVMGAVAASGGYMAAIASDHIIAHNGTLTGSIGVLMQSAEVTDLASKIGVKFNTYKSAPLKASPSPFEKANPLVDYVVQESIKDSADFFFGLVRERRGDKLNKAEANKIFDGRVFTGRQALRAGLIDEIGGKEQALNYLKSKNVDIELPLQDVAIIKEKDEFIGKIFGFLPWRKTAQMLDSSGGVMAILPQ